MNLRNFSLILVILIAAWSRIIPHPWNFTPIIAMGLFSGFYFKNDKISGVVLTLAAVTISNFFLEPMHIVLLLFVYLGISCTVLIGSVIPNKSFNNILFSSLGGSLVFFIASNFGVFMIGGYSYSIAGLIACYIAAIPFFYKTLLSTVIFAPSMFLLYDIIRNSIPQLNSDIA